jgi:anti-sigma regulatory factor (Ser/Thr protein kinase)
VVTVADPSQIGEARRAVQSLSMQIGLDETDAGRVAIVVTELATNVVRHGGGGQLLVRALPNRGGVEVIATDKGPGIGNVDRALLDGFSTGGTSGKGLGAVRRMSEVFDVYSRPGIGTTILSRMATAPEAPDRAEDLEVGAINVPAPGERVAGDAWLQLAGERGPAFVVVDGLGHGAPAHDAARCAVEVCARNEGSPPAELMTAMHAALRATRGAAVAIAEVDLDTRQVRFVGVGNIACNITSNDGTKSLASMNGIVGHEIRRVNEFTAPFDRDKGATLVAHSDGIATRWRLDQFPGVRPRHPALAAALLFRDFVRGRDDATVIAVRGPIR